LRRTGEGEGSVCRCEIPLRLPMRLRLPSNAAVDGADVVGIDPLRIGDPNMPEPEPHRDRQQERGTAAAAGTATARARESAAAREWAGASAGGSGVGATRLRVAVAWGHLETPEVEPALKLLDRVLRILRRLTH